MKRSEMSAPRLALRNLARHRLRNVLLGMSIGGSAGLLFLVLSVGRGIREQLVQNVVQAESGAVSVRLGSEFLKRDEAAQRGEIARIRRHFAGDGAVAGVRERVSTRAVLVVAGRTGDVQLKGIRPEHEGAVRRTLTFTSGGFIAAGDAVGVVLGESVAARLGASVGSDCVLMGQTHDGGVNTVDCRVAGIFRADSRFTSGYAYAPLSVAQSLYDVSSPTELLVDVHDLAAVPAVYRRASQALRPAEDGPVRLGTYRTRIGMASSIASINSWSLAAIVFCLLLISSVGISTAVINNVNERTAEIGTLLALGFRRGQVVRLFVLETVFLSVAATLAGVALAGAAVLLLARGGIDVGDAASLAFGVRVLRPDPSLQALLVAVSLGLALPALFALLPARRGSRLNPVDALRATP